MRLYHVVNENEEAVRRYGFLGESLGFSTMYHSDPLIFTEAEGREFIKTYRCQKWRSYYRNAYGHVRAMQLRLVRK